MTLKYITIIWVAILSILASSTFAANNSNLHLQLDKSCYVSGETIRFKNTITNAEKGKNNILFADLCGDGYLLSSAVIERSNGHWEGELSIPDSVQTGVYLVRAYSGNEFGEPTMVTQLVPVLNRFGNNEQNEVKKKSAYNQPYSGNIQNFRSKGVGIKTRSTKNIFAPNEEIVFNVERLGTDFIGGISFDVVKVDTSMFENSGSSGGFDVFAPSEKIKIYNGLTLRGKVTSKVDNVCQADEPVLFSIPDSIPQIAYSFTDSLGEFQFLIENCYGLQTAFVQTLNKQSKLAIEIYPTFLLPPTVIPFYVPFSLEESEFGKLAVKRASFSKAYSEVSQSKPTNDSIFKYPFYGISNNVVRPSEFIDLVDFKEISKEILPLVKYKYSENQYSISIYDPSGKISLNNPWVLVDGVPISDFSSLNKLNTSTIERVEVQPVVRCFGDLILEGVVSIFTKKGNFDGMNLPINAVKFSIDTYYKPTENRNAGQLFFQDVLCWNPIIDDNSAASKIKVQTSFEKGNYAAIAQSIDLSGNVHRSVFMFSVSE